MYLTTIGLMQEIGVRLTANVRLTTTCTYNQTLQYLWLGEAPTLESHPCKFRVVYDHKHTEK